MEGAQGYLWRLGTAPVRRFAGAALQIADGRRVWVRAIDPQDTQAEQQFFSGLSPNSRYRRFLLSARSIPESLVHALTAVDQYRHVALVALASAPEAGDAQQRIVADARYVWDNDGCRAEFALAVADDWQRQGLGAQLLRQLIEHARHAGVRELFGHVLADNLPMQALVRALGGRIVAHPQDETLRMARLDLQRTQSACGVAREVEDFRAARCRAQ